MPTTKLAPRRPVILIIMDGFGVNPGRLHNAVAQANTPNIDTYFSQFPLTLLQASGHAVGLPDGQMGNSEVGHLTIGSGSIIRQDLVAIDNAINSGEFFENRYLRESMQRASQGNGKIHLLGLVSNGGVHSHIRHLYALIDLCKRYSVKPMLHMITDGRDTAPNSALGHIEDLINALESAEGKVVTVSGRYYAMDRDNRWERIDVAWQAMVNGKGKTAKSARQAIEVAYANDLSDEFILPTVIHPDCTLNAEDELIFFNFRKDRARQMTAALFKQEFAEFDRESYQPVNVLCMTEYDEWFRIPYVMQQDKPKTTLAEIISDANIAQFHCAETEKYAHVTYFLNGRHGDAYRGEDRVILPSSKVPTYDLQPEMNAVGVADEVIRAIEKQQYGFIAVNFANCDMVGHTGRMSAAIKAVEAMDTEVGRVLDMAHEFNYSIVLTADHGNCEQMVDAMTNAPHTQHTVFPVPCLIVDQCHWQLAVGGGISRIAPTILHLMGLSKPESMTTSSLLLNPIRPPI